MPLDTVTKPTSEPLDLNELKDHLNMDGTTRFDSWLQKAITASVKPWQESLGIQMIEATLEWTMADFSRKTELPRPPLISVETVEYRDSAGIWQTVDAANYELNSKAEPGFIRFDNDYEVPETYENEEYPWKFTYKAGFQADDGSGGTKSTYAEVPPDLRLRMENAIGTLFMKREDTIISNRASVNVKQLEKAMGRLIRHHNKRVRFG